MISANRKKVKHNLLDFFPHRRISFSNLFPFTPDSLAGQMNALKSGGLSGAPPKRSRKHTPTDSSDDESDTEGEAGNDTSETDTDTDTDGE